MNSDRTPGSAKVAAGFVLTADDFAITGPVSRAILTLLEAGKLSATGAMTNRPDWALSASGLRGMIGKADLGVHLNLTCGSPLTVMPGLAPGGELPKLAPLLKAGIMGHLPRDEIEFEINAQLSAFEDAMGMIPDFIDGHQHVHALSGLRDCFLRVVAQRYPGREPYLRDSADSVFRAIARRRNAIKAIKISHLARPLGKKARALGFATNDGFAGYSAFSPEPKFNADFASYLVAPGKKLLVMCHPGFVDEELARVDTALESREAEFAFFSSGRFSEICDEAGMKPKRMRDL